MSRDITNNNAFQCTNQTQNPPYKLRVSVLRANEKGIFSHSPNGGYFILIVLGQERYLKIAEQCNSCWVVLKAVQQIYRRARSWTLGQLLILHIINSTFSSVCVYNEIYILYNYYILLIQNIVFFNYFYLQ